jgi:glutaconate CoA-transferase subunit A
VTARLGTWDEAVALAPDGSTVGFGGAVLSRKPVAAALALTRAGRRDLDLVTLAGSLEVEALLAAGALRSIASAYVGLGAYGRAPGFARAVAEGRVEDREMSEWMLVGGLRAAAMGVPFLPTRAALGSDLVEARGLRTVRDPYGGEELLAVPALAPDVTFLQVWRADADGDVQVPWPPDHLSDFDPLLARASRAVVVCAEEVVGRATVAATGELTQLFGFEVTMVVEAPGGAWPGAFPPRYAEDADWLAANAEEPGRGLAGSGSGAHPEMSTTARGGS